MTGPRPPEITGLRPRDALTAADRAEMFSLLSQHFDGVTHEQFARDLTEKNWVVEIRHERRLVGFSTLLVQAVEFEGCPLTAIYSGDTIMSPEAWGTTALARTWIAAVNWLRAASPARPCYWLLLTSGFRTYRFLPVFWKEFFPRHETRTPASRQRLLDHLASRRYGGYYDATKGVVRFPHPQKLRGSLGMLPAGRADKPDVAYFLSRNPGHAGGDELACITEINAANLTPAGRRMVTATPG